MSTPIIARKDFDDAVRSKMILAITGIFLFFMTLLVAAPAIFGNASDFSTGDALSLTILPSETIIPIVALIVGYMAIVGERQSGSVKVLLGFPHKRRDIVAGKLIGRTGVIALGITVGFVVAGIAGVGLYGDFPAADFVGLLGATLFLGLTFVGFAVGTSAAVTTRGKAMAIVVGMFVIVNVLWQLVTSLILYAVEGGEFPQETPNWFEFLQFASPIKAYEGTVRAVTDLEVVGLFGGGGIRESAAADAPVYLQDWFGFVILAVWMLVPLAIGYWRFERANLG